MSGAPFWCAVQYGAGTTGSSISPPHPTAATRAHFLHALVSASHPWHQTMTATAILRLTEYRAITFDVYGTIINWEPEIAAFLRSWTAAEGLDASDSDLLLLYDRLRQPIQRERPAHRYPEVLRRTLDAMASELRCSLPAALRSQFGNIAGSHKPYPDAQQSLLQLQDQGFVLGALSNIDDASFATMTQTLGVTFDVIVTAERVGAYKPDPTHFLAALSDLLAQGIQPEQVLHVAQSKRADIVTANQLGLTCVWVNRQGHLFGRQGDGAEQALPDYEVSTLAELLKG